MKYPDVVLVAIPATYLLVTAGLFPLDVSIYDAVLVASLAASTVLFQALFVNPPE